MWVLSGFKFQTQYKVAFMPLWFEFFLNFPFFRASEDFFFKIQIRLQKGFGPIVSVVLTLFIKWDRINSTIKSITEQANDFDCPLAKAPSVALIFRCLIGALCNLTEKTRFGSCISALAYWSSVTHNNIKKLNFTVFVEDSDLVSWK